MTIREVLHALVNQLPQDWDHDAMHTAVDEHLDGPAPAPAEQPAADSPDPAAG